VRPVLKHWRTPDQKLTCIRGEPLTDSHDKATKLLIYKKLFTLNRAFVHLERNLNSLLAADVVSEEITRAFQNRLRELQAEINQELTLTLSGAEYQDARKLGKINEQREEIESKRKILARKKTRR
jgi:hypothetical protein